MLLRLGKLALTIIVGIGVIRGVMRYNDAAGGDGVARVLGAFVGAISDIVYRWLPPTFEFIGQFLSSFT